MKRTILLALALFLMVACTSQSDLSISEIRSVRTNQHTVLHATTEGTAAPATKVYADDQLRVLWNEGDQLTVFTQNTYNSKFEFAGEDGDNAGDFEDVTPSGLHSGNALNYIYAVYPYANGNKINNDGNTITLNLPSEQRYKEHSFGIGANTMVAVTDDSYLAFKNLCGYLQLRLYGDNVKVSSIKIQGNNGEKIAGKSSVALGLGTIPTVTMDETATDAITLVCDPPVEIGTTADNYTDFWFVIPPTTFSNGFKITVTDDQGGVFQKTTTKGLTIRRSQIEYMKALQVTPTYNNLSVNKYLSFTSEGMTTVSLTNNGGNAPLLYYSTDATNWIQWDYSGLTFTSNEPLFICGDNPDGFSYSYNQYSAFAADGDKFTISGDVMSLLNKTEESVVVPCDYCFVRLFRGCKNLTAAPLLPATTLTNSCYDSMFSNCTSLSTAPELPATTLTIFCYCGMFSNCTSLSTAPELPATTLTIFCYYGMFSGCTSLNQAPNLPATTLADYCYEEMFCGCSSLTVAPELPAMILAERCYYHMFGWCTSLTNAPELPATSLASGCYFHMFSYCTGLKIAPELHATNLADRCYSRMFYGCSNLNYVKCLATDMSDNTRFELWLCDVASSGTFVKAASMNDWPIGDSGIPEGWTVQNAE